MTEARAESYGAIRRRLDEGDHFAAYDLTRRALEDSPDDVVLLELRARAEERLFLDSQLEESLDRLAELAPDSEELHGYRGKLKKRQAARATGEERRALCREALEAYQHGYERTGGYWTGINVATLQFLLGDRLEAAATAAQVQQEVEALLPGQAPDSIDAFWSLGTLGDALLIQGQVDAAIARYEQLREGTVRCDALRVLSSVRENAREILAHGDGAPSARERVEHALRAPRLALCVGHMVDRPERKTQRFPDYAEVAVAETLGRLIDAEDVRFGISSLAAGADILFQEALAERGILRHVVLPYPAEDFLDVSVSADWTERFDALCHADRCSQILPHRLDAGGLEFDLVNRYIDGLAQIRADQMGAELTRIAVWNGEPGDGRGGTADTVQMWLSRPNAQVAIVDPLHGRVRIEQAGSEPESLVVENEVADAAICALLFADARDYSKLDEKQIIAFVDVFLGGLAAIIDRAHYKEHVRVRNTWGDAIFLALDDIPLAGALALDMREFVRSADSRKAFREAGLPDSMDLRIALHAAVVNLVMDPITNIRRVAGTQVSHAARIEPITPVGEVYASDAFAALSRADGATGFRCEYVGRTMLAKDFGEFPTYHIRRA